MLNCNDHLFLVDLMMSITNYIYINNDKKMNHCIIVHILSFVIILMIIVPMAKDREMYKFPLKYCHRINSDWCGRLEDSSQSCHVGLEGRTLDYSTSEIRTESDIARLTTFIQVNINVITYYNDKKLNKFVIMDQNINDNNNKY